MLKHLQHLPRSVPPSVGWLVILSDFHSVSVSVSEMTLCWPTWRWHGGRHCGWHVGGRHSGRHGGGHGARHGGGHGARHGGGHGGWRDGRHGGRQIFFELSFIETKHFQAKAYPGLRIFLKLCKFIGKMSMFNFYLTLNIKCIWYCVWAWQPCSVVCPISWVGYTTTAPLLWPTFHI